MTTGKETVALVHDWLTGMRGGENVLEAIGDLYPESPIYTLFHFPGSVSPALESHAIHPSFLQKAPFAKRAYRSYLPFFANAIEDFDLAGFDLVISSSHCVAKGVLVPPGAYHLCYCHTPVRYAWDQEHTYFPRRHGVKARLRSWILHRLRIWDAGSSSRVDLFVANSHFVASRIRRFYGRKAEVVAPPVEVDFYQQGLPEKPKRDYCLMVSALAPYKRVDLAIEACRRSNVELRVVGTGPEQRRLENLADKSCRLLGRVSHEELRSLYQNALCFVQPGVEDFGIAAVESLASGTPVVALRRGGVLDIVKDGEHGVLYDGSESAEDLSAAIDKSRQIRFNTLKLTARAEQFSRARFDLELKALLASRPTDLRGGGDW